MHLVRPSQISPYLPVTNAERQFAEEHASSPESKTRFENPSSSAPLARANRLPRRMATLYSVRRGNRPRSVSRRGIRTLARRLFELHLGELRCSLRSDQAPR